ncbi:integrating conjugative element protein%2C PFL_4669 family [Yersinia similis]|uniref:Integrating conjugative element protein, PFL_4669 family n=1 Tax=Yersinia similis TaxID=367190 RepID=A0A0T9RR92_9GAMM|nr:TIGR03761 family integrating conjugative element protein [Yersinia similis]CNI78867.1 integrating conjugative element protein%2C PFL_4669 family [Yersinia similis]
MSGKIKIGVLRSELNIELHTFYAINTWTGRHRTEHKGGIIGMPRFFRLISNIHRDSIADNPYADAAMLCLEALIDDASRHIQYRLDAADILMAKQIPANITLSDPVSSEPLNIGVHSYTPLGYRCVYLLVGFDQLALRLFQLHHYGLISTQYRDHGLQEGGSQIRRIFTCAQSYRSISVSRTDIALNNDSALQAVKLLGNVDEAILLGEKRSRFSPLVNSDAVLLLKNSQYE